MNEGQIFGDPIIVGHIAGFLAEFSANVTQNDRVYISSDYFCAIDSVGAYRF